MEEGFSLSGKKTGLTQSIETTFLLSLTSKVKFLSLRCKTRYGPE